MKISIKEGKQRFFIPIPIFVVLNSLSLRLLKKQKGSYGVDFSDVTPRQIRNIRRCIRRMKRIHKDWYLVDLVDGSTTVKIKM